MSRHLRGVLVALTVCSSPSLAVAEPSEQDRVLANALFDEARALMAERRFAEACPKFAESLRLQPGGGTLLNLAVCHDEEGKTATAWGELKSALALARRDGRADREALALERLAGVERKLSYVTIRVPEDARVAGLQVKVDDTVFREPSWGSARPIDRGEHQIVVSAPGYASFETSVTIEKDGYRATIDLPRLVPLPKASPEQPPSILRGQHVAGIVAGGFGLIGIAVGTGFGVSATNRWADSDAGCPRPDRCTEEGAQAALDAGRHADLSTVAFVVGGAGLGLGAILFATGPSLVVKAAPTSASASLELQWP